MRTKTKIKSLILGIAIFCISPIWANEILESKLQTKDLGDVGSYKVRIDNYGEPNALPLRISLSVMCGEEDLSKMIIEDEVACEFVSAVALKKDFILTYKIQNETGEKCSQEKIIKKPFSELCK